MSKVITKVKSYLRIVYAVKNWISFTRNYLLSNETYTVKFRGKKGIDKIVVYRRDIDRMMVLVSFYRECPTGFFDGEVTSVNFKGRVLKLKSGDSVPVLGEQFHNEVYKQLNVKGKTVIDVAAGYADASIYFAVRGAKRVVGFEPYKKHRDLGLENIALNHLEDTCEIHNYAIGDMNIDDFRNHPSYPKIFWVQNNYDYDTHPVPMITLEAAMKIAHEDRDLVLKMDSEGFEYETILNANPSIISAFDEIIMEFHYGCKKIAERLKQCGFNVICGKATFEDDYSRFPPYNLKNIGILYAKKA